MVISHFDCKLWCLCIITNNNVLRWVIIVLFDYSSHTGGIGFRQLCAGGQEGVSSCYGDSGGPMVNQMALGKQVKFVQFGVVSSGYNTCGTQGQPGILANVVFYIDWILDTIKPWCCIFIICFWLHERIARTVIFSQIMLKICEVIKNDSYDFESRTKNSIIKEMYVYMFNSILRHISIMPQF